MRRRQQQNTGLMQTARQSPNSYGDKVAKHYYTDSEGADALDSSGKKIAIPINDSGVEVPDAKFQEHYAAGYYATGSLVLPDGAE